MASALIHLAIAKNLLKDLNIKNQKDFFLGSIAPDLSKQIGLNRIDSHFLIHTQEDVPNINIFINKYRDFKNNAFDLGYFVHLYTDKLWFHGFLDNFICNNSIKLLDGTIIQTTKDEMRNMIYSDYTNMNIQIIENYDLDLSLFYEEFQIPKTTINEIPIDKLDILINQMGILIENSKEEKSYTIDINLVNSFIETACKEILQKLKALEEI